MNNSNDQIITQITYDEQVIIKKIPQTDTAYLQALETTLNEWNSENDTQDYANL